MMKLPLFKMSADWLRSGLGLPLAIALGLLLLASCGRAPTPLPVPDQTVVEPVLPIVAFWKSEGQDLLNSFRVFDAKWSHDRRYLAISVEHVLYYVWVYELATKQLVLARSAYSLCYSDCQDVIRPAFAWNPKQNTLLILSPNQKLESWDIDEVSQNKTLQSPAGGGFSGFAWNRAGTKIVTTSEDDRAAAIWDFNSGTIDLNLNVSDIFFIDPTNPLYASIFSVPVWNIDDSQIFLDVNYEASTWHANRNLEVFSSSTGEISSRIAINGHRYVVKFLKLNSTGSKILYGIFNNDPQRIVLDLDSMVENLLSRGFDSPPTEQTFWFESGIIAQERSPFGDLGLNRIDLLPNGGTDSTFLENAEIFPVPDFFDFSEDKNQALIYFDDTLYNIGNQWQTRDRGIEIFDLTSKQYTPLLNFSQDESLKIHKSNAYSVSVSPNGEQIASAGRDGTVKIWGLYINSTYLYMRHSLNSQDGSVYSVAWNSNGSKLASSSHNGSISIWNPSINKPLLTIPAHSYAARSVAWQPNSTTLASAGWDNQVKLWNTETGGLLRTLAGHIDFVNSVAWRNDGQILASSSSDGTVKLWNPSDGSIIKTFNHGGSVMSMAWSSDGGKLASVGSDKNLRVWNATTGALIYASQEHFETIRSVAWSADNTIIITGGDDGMRVYNASNGQLLFGMSEKNGIGMQALTPVFSIKMLPNNRVVVAEQNGKISTFELIYPNPASNTLLPTTIKRVHHENR
jgi:WD40 repeat protein